MQRLRPRPTYANVMATIAVFIALGGGAYAAINLPKNSVGTKQIKNNAVTSSKVKNGSLSKQDFKAGQLSAGPQGIQGIQGPQGQKGDTGSPGTPGQNATKLFAYIRDTGSAESVDYGSGVTAVSGTTPYVVTFDRSLENCVVQATPGFGDPTGSLASVTVDAIPHIEMDYGDHSKVGVLFEKPDLTASRRTSFFITAFC